MLEPLALCLTVVSTVAQVGPDRAEQLPEQLRNVLHHDCGSCHGITMKGGLGRPLTPTALQTAEVEALTDIILNGIPGTAMPAWRPLLTESEARWIANFLKNRKDEK